jgi:hypothetical protein
LDRAEGALDSTVLNEVAATSITRRKLMSRIR